MTVRELMNKLLNLPMNHEIFLYCDKEHIDEYGEECSGYCFDIDDVRMCNRNSEIIFMDWRDKAELPKHTNSLPTQADNRVKPYKKVNAIIIPDNATNGDMIKAMFPNFKINEEWKATRQFELRTDCIEITGIATSDWWNAPYKTRSE